MPYAAPLTRPPRPPTRRAEQIGLPEDEVGRGHLEPTALKRFVDPEDIAAMAILLASNEGRSITGETIGVSSVF